MLQNNKRIILVLVLIALSCIIALFNAGSHFDRVVDHKSVDF